MPSQDDSIKVKPIYIDDLASRCGYFEDGAVVNNGYGCTHPGQQEYDEIDGIKHGKCYPFSCPIAISLSPNECPEDREYFPADGVEGWKNMTDGDWMLIIKEEPKRNGESHAR